MDVRQPTQQATIRRLQDNLVVLGTGILAFGAWTLVRSIMLFTLGNTSMISSMDLQASDGAMLMFVYVTLAIATVIELAFRAYAGFSARAEGMGARKGWGYLVIVILMALSSFGSIAYNCWSLVTGHKMIFDFIVNQLIEGTSFVLLVMLVHSAVRLRKIMRAAE